MNRVKYIDIIKTIGIYLVVCTHTNLWINIDSKFSWDFLYFVCIFHMPLFFYAYGLAIPVEKVVSYKWKEYILKRFKQLVVPYFLWTNICLGGGSDLYANLKCILWGTNPSLGLGGYNQVLWFIPCFFLATIIYKMTASFICQFNRGFQAIMALTCFVVGFLLALINIPNMLPWGLCSAFVGTGYMIVASISSSFFNRSFSKRMKMTTSLISVMALVLVFFLAKKIGYIVMALGQYSNRLLYLFSAILALYAISFIAKSFENIMFMDWFGKNTLVILATHYTIFRVTIPWMSGLLSAGIKSVYIPFINAVVAFGISIPLIILINYFAPILNGKIK